MKEYIVKNAYKALQYTDTHVDVFVDGVVLMDKWSYDNYDIVGDFYNLTSEYVIE